jgi:predicted nucleotidyltransferase
MDWSDLKEQGMSIAELLKDKREEILLIAAKHGVKKISVFGSVARREAKENSDIDFLIEVDRPATPWFPGGLVADLEELLGRHVDVVEPEALQGSLRQHILREALPL